MQRITRSNKKNYSLKNAQKDLPRRLKQDNKTRGGKCLVIAGAQGQWGAAVLCARAAARVGAGYVFVNDFKKVFPTLRFPDFLISSNTKDFSKFQSVAIGPGVKDQSYLKRCILKLAQMEHPAVVLDAEAISVLAKAKKPFYIPSKWILTPHEGELSRLLKVSSDTIRSNRERYVSMAQKQWGCHVVLKGADTLIADGDVIYKINSGNSSLAKAGTGDVLTGIIAGFLSQGLPPLKAACLGVFVQGYISDLWIKEGNDQLSLLASDLIESIPHALSQIRRGKNRSSSNKKGLIC